MAAILKRYKVTDISSPIELTENLSIYRLDNIFTRINYLNKTLQNIKLILKLEYYMNNTEENPIYSLTTNVEDIITDFYGIISNNNVVIKLYILPVYNSKISEIVNTVDIDIDIILINLESSGGGSGQPGKDGLNMLSGDTEPNNENGVDGEIYLHYTVGDLYKKEAGVWELVANIDGTDGTDGLNVISGVTNPDIALGVDGELYINISTFEIFRKEMGTWVSKGSIKGTNGNTGLSILSGDVNPSIEGVDGDLYLNLISYELFKKISGSWVSQGIIKGTDGIDGYGIWSDNRNPISTDGVDNELFLNLDTYELFKKVSGSWVSQGTINGEDGNDGTDGLSFLSGSVNPTTEGKDNDLYLNLDTYELFKKVSGSWVSQGIIKGTDGTTPDTSMFYKNNSISATISGTYNIDLNNAENYFLTVTANTEFSLIPIDKDNINQSVTVVFKMDGTGGYVLSTSENIYWKDELPTFNTDPNAINIVTFMTFDKGVTWIGHLVGNTYIS